MESQNRCAQSWPTCSLDEHNVTQTAHIREELGADSLDVVEIICALANTFKIDVCDDDVQNISTIHEIATYIADKSAI
ncbi:acyl carrier protein [Chloroflexi bacterium TSY]|nr:acyl carrier protein [Chloroflexi bacterium TSY]